MSVRAGGHNMAGTKTFGAILIVLCVPAFLLSVLYLFSETSAVPAFVQGARQLSGYASAGVGVLFLVVGIILLMVQPKKTVAPVVMPVAAPQEVEIKRT